MNRKQIELGAFVVIGLAILGLWAWQTFLKPEAPKPPEVALKMPEIQQVKIEDETAQYKITVSYPEFQNLGDSNRQSAANNLIKQKVEQSINSFKNAVKEVTDEIPNVKSEMKIEYEAIYLNPSLASIKISEYTYIEGAAHPIGIYWPFNYNFRDNKEIVLADLFNPGSNYLSILSDVSRESLKNQLKESYDPESVEFGTSPTSENFSVFFLDKDKLTIIFNVYAVAGYAAGSQTVEIPYDKLTEVINSEGLIKLIRAT